MTEITLEAKKRGKKVVINTVNRRLTTNHSEWFLLPIKRKKSTAKFDAFVLAKELGKIEGLERVFFHQYKMLISIQDGYKWENLRQPVMESVKTYLQMKDVLNAIEIESNKKKNSEYFDRLGLKKKRVFSEYALCLVTDIEISNEQKIELVRFLTKINQEVSRILKIEKTAGSLTIFHPPETLSK